MLPKVLPVARLGSVVISKQAVRCMGGHTPAHWKSEKDLDIINKVHMDFHPVPEGSWKENFDRRNKRMNISMVGAAAFLVSTIAVMYSQDSFNFHEITDVTKIKLSGPGLKYE